jgi:hypothetical protein
MKFSKLLPVGLTLLALGLRPVQILKQKRPT